MEFINDLRRNVKEDTKYNQFIGQVGMEDVDKTPDDSDDPELNKYTRITRELSKMRDWILHWKDKFEKNSMLYKIQYDEDPSDANLNFYNESLSLYKSFTFKFPRQEFTCFDSDNKKNGVVISQSDLALIEKWTDNYKGKEKKGKEKQIDKEVSTSIEEFRKKAPIKQTILDTYKPKPISHEKKLAFTAAVKLAIQNYRDYKDRFFGVRASHTSEESPIAARILSNYFSGKTDSLRQEYKKAKKENKDFSHIDQELLKLQHEKLEAASLVRKLGLDSSFIKTINEEKELTDAQRYQMAKTFIEKYPKNQFSEELSKVIKASTVTCDVVF